MTSLRLIVALMQAASAAPAPAAPAAYPFVVGEKLSYSAKLGMLTLGSATLEVASMDTVRGVKSLRLRFRLKGKTAFYSLDDVLESWVDASDLHSRRFVQDFEENGKSYGRRYEIYPDSGFYREAGRDTSWSTPARPLDDAAFFYFVRVTPLEVGRKYTYNRYFRKEKNPVTIEVLKREKLELPDGSDVNCLVLHPTIDTRGLFSKREKLELPDGTKVNCLVLHPTIDTRGLFSKRSETRIWLTDDVRRLPVQIRTKFPFGTITLRLKDMVLPGATTSAMSR